MNWLCNGGQALSGVDASLRSSSNVLESTALQATLNTQFLFQIGIFTAVPMIVNLILEEGILRVCDLSLLIPNLLLCNKQWCPESHVYCLEVPVWQTKDLFTFIFFWVSEKLRDYWVQAVISFCAMQLQLASVFFTFSLGTRTHYFGRTVLHGGAKVTSVFLLRMLLHLESSNFAECWVWCYCDMLQLGENLYLPQTIASSFGMFSVIQHGVVQGWVRMKCWLVQYRSTGRGFVVRHIKFAENYRQYSRSHFTKA